MNAAAAGVAMVALLIWVYLWLCHGRFWSAGPVLQPVVATRLPALDVVVPARDEAEGIGPAVQSLLHQNYPGPLRFVIVDDGSKDGTGEIVRRLVDPRIMVVEGAPRPDGWSGKLWALEQGVALGHADLVLLTDADIVHDPRHLATLVTKLQTGLDMVSEMVELRCESPAERALVPAFVFFFQLLYPFSRVNDPASATAAAAGGTVLVRRAALEAVGGIASLRGALIDDVALAGRLKTRGPIFLGHSCLARSVRPYPGAADIWRMVARTAYVQLRFSPLLLFGVILGLAIVWLAPISITLLGHGWPRGAAFGAWMLSMLSFIPTLRRFGQSPLWAAALPGIACFYMAATIGSAVDHHLGRGVRWKDRAYTGAAA